MQDGDTVHTASAADAAAADERERTFLLDSALGACATGLAALLLTAVRVESDLGLTLRTGTERLPLTVPVLGLVALALCVLARAWRDVTPAAAAIGGVSAAVAALTSLPALRAPHEGFTGPAGWLAVGGFASTAVLALLTSLGSPQVRRRRPSGSDGPGAARAASLMAARCAALVAMCVTGLLLPWRHGGPDAPGPWLRSGFCWPTAVVALEVLFLATLAVSAVYYAARPSPRRGAWLRTGCSWLGAITVAVSLISLAATGGEGNGRYLSWPGPAVFLGAAAAAVVLCARAPSERLDAGRQENAPALRRLHVSALGVGFAALVLAAGGLSAAWTTLTSDALTPLHGAPGVSWTGLETSGHAARIWVLAVGAVLALAALSWSRSRRHIAALVLAVTGALALALGVGELFADRLTGMAATIAPGYGAWSFALGGLLALCGGVVALGAAFDRRGRRAAGTALATVALAVPMAGAITTIEPAEAGAPAPQAIFTDNPGTSARLGEATTNTRVGRFEGIGREVVLDQDGRVWFAIPVDTDGDGDEGQGTAEGAVLIAEDVAGRALPALTVEHTRAFSLLAVTGDQALIVTNNLVAWVDLRGGSVALDDYRSVAVRDPHVQVVLAAAARAYQHRAGTVPLAGFRVRMNAGGSVLITGSTQDHELRRYRVDAAQVASRKPWTPTRLQVELPEHSDGVTLAPHSAAYYRTGFGIYRIRPGHASVPTPVLGNVSDSRCTLSRDPRSVNLARLELRTFALDAAGDLWFVLRDDSENGSTLYVITTDGLLRRVGLSGANHLQPARGGGLIVDYGSSRIRDYDWNLDRRPTLLIPDAAAAAQAAPALGPVPDACVSDNRVHPPSAGHHATLLRTLHGPAASAVLVAPIAADGAVAYVPSEPAHRLVVDRPGAPPRTVYHSASTIRALYADGRGGAWWLQRAPGSRTSAAFSIGHLDASGAARILAPAILHGEADADVAMAVDAVTGELWWRPLHSPQGWWHMDATGDRAQTAQHWPKYLLVADGHAYTRSVRGSTSVEPITPQGEGPPILGGGRALAIPSAQASNAPARDYVARGSAAFDRDARLLLHQRNYLIRVDGPHEVTLLAGPGDGLPLQEFGETLTVVGDHLLIRTTDGDLYRVAI